MTATLRSLEARARPLAEAFVRFLADHMRVEVTSARRDRKTQQRLYNDYLAGRSKFPAAPPGKSLHGLGVAFDLRLDGILPPKDPPYPWQYELAGTVWEQILGLTWGGRFRDPIHFDTRPFR